MGPRRRRTFNKGEKASQFDHEVLEIARVVRVVKGGRRFRFRASVVVGDRSGMVGLGVGKSRDVQQAIKKAEDAAAKRVIKVSLKKGTILHSVQVSYKGAQILLKPAKPGTGVIAGGIVRTVADLAGIKDLVSKRYGSVNKMSNAKAALAALVASGVSVGSVKKKVDKE
ncbi:MAG: 30S ribosomal protein S5 [bacterium]|nr:30S ribosomal protein S5 [bacterium]